MPFFRFLLKAVKNVNPVSQFDCVDSPVCSAFVVLNNFQNARRFKSFEWFCIRMFLSALSKVNGKAENIFDIFRHFVQILFG